jgi:hypothetical protein
MKTAHDNIGGVEDVLSLRLPAQAGSAMRDFAHPPPLKAANKPVAFLMQSNRQKFAWGGF